MESRGYTCSYVIRGWTVLLEKNQETTMDENDFEIPIAHFLHFVKTLDWWRTVYLILGISAFKRNNFWQWILELS